MNYLSPFSHFARGSQPSILNTNFRTYVWPRFTFTAPLWIFRIKSPFHYSADFEYGYKTVFQTLESRYIDCGRRILGAHPKTAGLAILVRLGWLPLEYRLALNAVMWSLRTLNDIAGPTLHAFYTSISDQPDKLQRTATLQPAFDFLAHLNKFADTDLFAIPIKRVKQVIQTAMFNELTIFWRDCGDCTCLHAIYDDWQPRKLASRIFSRVTTSCYHDFACGHSKLRARHHHFGIAKSPLCRHGCDAAETAEHVLLHCPFFTKERLLINTKCLSLGLDISLRTFLTNNQIHTVVERLLSLFLKHHKPV